MSGNTVDKCFAIVTNPNLDVAVRVHAIQILFELSLFFPELLNALELSLLPILESASKPSILIRTRKVLKKNIANKKSEYLSIRF